MRRITPRRVSPPRRLFTSSSNVLSKTATFVAKEREKHGEMRQSGPHSPFVAGGSIGNLWNGSDIKNFSHTDISVVSQRSIRSVSANVGGVIRRSPSLSMKSTGISRGKSVTITRVVSEEKIDRPPMSTLNSSRRLKDILCLTDDEDDDVEPDVEPEPHNYTTTSAGNLESNPDEGSFPRLSRARSDFSDISVPGSTDGLYRYR